LSWNDAKSTPDGKVHAQGTSAKIRARSAFTEFGILRGGNCQACIAIKEVLSTNAAEAGR
jgi:hypothetical protein